MKSVALLILTGLFCLPASAFEVIRLDDGTVIRGEVISRNDSIVEIESENMGRVKVKRRHIVSSPVKDTEVRSARRVAGIDPDPIGHTLLFMPTAFTPPKGSVVFRDFELLFLTLGYSPTSSTSVVAGAMFPVTSEFNALTLGVKQGVYQKANGAVALAGNVTLPIGGDIDESGILWLLNAVASYRFDDRLGVHMAAGGIGAQGRGENVQGISVGLGTDVRLGPHVKLLGEVLHGATTFDPVSAPTSRAFAPSRTRAIFGSFRS
jgi:hypothetical protein